MKSMTDLFGNYRIAPKKGVGGGQRGALLQFFCEKLNPSRIATGYKPLNEKAIIRLLPFMNDIRSLFWLKSVCEDTERRGGSFSKKFWYIQKEQKSANELVDKV